MKKTREFCFSLPIGYLDADGNYHKEVVLKKMTGHEELLMTEPDLANNGARLVTELLCNCVVRLGKMEKVNQEQVTELYSPDRDFLIVKLRSITFGNNFETSYICESCGSSVHCTHDLDSLTMKKLNGKIVELNAPGEITVQLEDGYEDKDEIYTHMTFRLPNGKDEEVTAGLAKQNITRAKNAIWTRCLKKFGKMEERRFQALGTKIFLDLGLKDRRILDHAFAEQLPEIDLNKELICPHCQNNFWVRIDLGNFLLPV